MSTTIFTMPSIVRRFWQTEGNAVTIVVNITIALSCWSLAGATVSTRPTSGFAAAALVWALRNLNYWVTNPVVPDLLFAGFASAAQPGSQPCSPCLHSLCRN